MIFVSLSEPDGDWLGHWYFDALPRVGDRIAILADRYEVLGVEHWPHIDGVPDDDPSLPRTKIFVRPLPSTGDVH